MSWITQVLGSLARPFQWWVVVAPWEQGLRVRLGKRTDLLRKGIHFRIPFLDRVYLISTRLRAIQDKGQTMMTKDGKVATVSTAIQFEVVDAKKLFETISTPEMTLIARVASAIAATVSETNGQDLSYERIQDAATAAVPGDEWGLGSVAVRVTDLAFVRTYRLLMNEYRSLAGLDNLLAKQEEKSGGLT